MGMSKAVGYLRSLPARDRLRQIVCSSALLKGSYKGALLRDDDSLPNP